MHQPKRMRQPPQQYTAEQGETTMRNQLALKITFTMQLLMLFTSAILLLIGAN